MTQIAPATLLAIQSYSAPTTAKAAAPGAFEPLSAGDLAPRSHGGQAGQGDVQVRLSSEALTFLGGEPQARDATPPRSPAAPKATADAYRSEPPGSRLDISV